MGTPSPLIEEPAVTPVARATFSAGSRSRDPPKPGMTGFSNSLPKPEARPYKAGRKVPERSANFGRHVKFFWEHAKQRSQLIKKTS
jgi:hypothetical protein